MKHIVIFLIRIYQVTLSPLLLALGGRCIYKTSCSEFAVHAFKNYRFSPALILASKRFFSCNPLTAYKRNTSSH